MNFNINELGRPVWSIIYLDSRKTLQQASGRADVTHDNVFYFEMKFPEKVIPLFIYLAQNGDNTNWGNIEAPSRIVINRHLKVSEIFHMSIGQIFPCFFHTDRILESLYKREPIADNLFLPEYEQISFATFVTSLPIR